MSAGSGRELHFVKMHGAGNDYVIVDAISQEFPLERAGELAVTFADRHRGIGSDGLILLASSDQADCRMLMWNADGSRGAMCGNGLRCLAKLAYDLGLVSDRNLRVQTDSGIRTVELLASAGGEIHAARVDMGAVSVDSTAISIDACGQTFKVHRGDAGNPHAVIFIEGDLSQFPVNAVGAAFQDLEIFPQGVNVEFVTITGTDSLAQRTYERGSGETQACGSGASVAALAAMATGRCDGPTLRISLPGGELKVTRQADSLVMEGPIKTVFSGKLLLDT